MYSCDLMSLLVLSGFIFSGALMKLADEMEDGKLLLPAGVAYLTGIAYGALIGLLMVFDKSAAHLFGGIIIGCLVTGKIDAESHYLALGTILLIVLSKGLVLSMPLLLTIAVLAAIDELTSDSGREVLGYRVVLKIGVVLMVVLGVVHWYAALYLLSFDGVYLVMGRLLNRS